MLFVVWLSIVIVIGVVGLCFIGKALREIGRDLREVPKEHAQVTQV